MDGAIAYAVAPFFYFMTLATRIRQRAKAPETFSHLQYHELLTAMKDMPHYPIFLTRITNALMADRSFGAGLPAAEREDAARRIARVVVDELSGVRGG